MNTLYWITRFDGLNSFSLTLGIVFTIVLVIILISTIAIGFDEGTDSKEFKTIIKWDKIVAPIFLLAWIFHILIPTTKEALLIYGVGGTIDYVKENPVAKQLPNKCIIALDKWVDSFNTDSTKVEKNN